MRLRKYGAFSFATLMLLLLVGSQFGQSLQGNVALMRCWRMSNQTAFASGSCGQGNASPTQRKIIRYIYSLSNWESANFIAIAENCGQQLCDCFSDDETSEPLLHDRMQAYHAAVSYRVVNDEFPAMDACAEYIWPSEFILKQSQPLREGGDQELADILREFAYLIDRDWEHDWQRGTTAFLMALQYEQRGDRDAAIVAYRKAVESLKNTNRSSTDSYLRQSIVSLADLYLLDNAVENALLTLEEGVAIFPNDAHLRIALDELMRTTH